MNHDREGRRSGPRLAGIRERFDRAWYDTVEFHAGDGEGWQYRMFGAANIGNQDLTNLQVPSQLARDRTAVVLAIGLHIPFTTRDEEDLLLDHFTLTPIIGDKRYGTYHGDLLSTRRIGFENWPDLRITFLQPQIWQLTKKHGYTTKKPLEKDELYVALDWLLEKGIEIKEPELPTRPGYQLGRPIVIPVRQSFWAELVASRVPQLLRAWEGLDKDVPLLVRATFIGLETRDVS